MSAYPSVEVLLKELGGKRERFLINHLFTYKSDSYDAILFLVKGDERFLNSLIAKGVLVRNGLNLILDDRIKSFFENFLEINQDIQNYHIDDRLDFIRNQMQLFSLEESWDKKEKLIFNVKTAFMELGRVINRNVIELNKRVQQDYKTESSVKIKRFKIEEHEKKAKKLRALIGNTERLILSKTLFFEEVSDPNLDQAIIDLKYDYIRKAKTNLRELQQEILAYLNKFNFLNSFFTKLQLIRKMKNHFELEQKTNVEQCFQANNALIFEPRINLPTNPSISFLETDSGYDLLEKVSKAVKHKSKKSLIKSIKIDENTLDLGTKRERWFNYKEIKIAFARSEIDLFQFILAYKYEEEMDFEAKVKVFCKIALLYENELDFTGHVDNHNGLRYAVILHKA